MQTTESQEHQIDKFLDLLAESQVIMKRMENTLQELEKQFRFRLNEDWKIVDTDGKS